MLTAATTMMRTFARLLAASAGLGALVSACASKEHAPYLGPTVGDNQTPAITNDCGTPQTGCTCDQPGLLVDCGEVTYRSGDYFTCSAGKRRCGEDQRWGECIGERTYLTSKSSKGGLGALALSGSATKCSDPCDPNCRIYDDDGNGLDPQLPGVVCETAGGIGVCPTCGYSVAHADSVSLDSTWTSTQPKSCDATHQCNFDEQCRQGTCQNWRYPCTTPDKACVESDLTLGAPCTSSNRGLHVPVCNRGSVRADSGTLRIGFYADPSRIGQCADATYDAPDAGLIEFELSTAPGHYIDPGQCLDVTSMNSTVTGTAVSGPRALFVNFDAGVADCNLCNNWQALDPDASCTGCVGLACNQTCAATNLTGVVTDPGSVTPLPNVMVYVPNEALEPFSDAMSCDSCDSLVSGSPIASTFSGSDGSFTLTDVPVGVSFPLVIQTGRWRRQVTVPAIPACANAELAPELSHLPRNRDEGDMPKIAVVMGDADPIQCIIRKIGVDPNEITGSQGDGRIQLFNANGMQFSGSRQGYLDIPNYPVSLLSDPDSMDQYNAIYAPCDYRHTYAPTLTAARSGPSYNSPPRESTTAAQRANMKSYLDRGGRLFVTHLLAQDFVYDLFDPPDAPSTQVFTPSNSALLSGLGWQYQDETSFNPNAPAVFMFGRNIEYDRGTPKMVYAIDTSSDLGSTFAEWANQVGASPDGEETVSFDFWNHSVSSVRAPAVRLAYGDSTTALGRPQDACRMDLPLTDPNNCRYGGARIWGGEHVALFQFDTPWGLTQNQCGRVEVAEAHAAQHACRSPSSIPPRCAPPTPDCACNDLSQPAAWDAGCGADLSLSPAELAFEFMMFQSTQCIGEISAPQQPVRLESGTFTRDYEAVCPGDKWPEWEFFSWQARVPAGTSLEFSAQTADTRAELASAPRLTLASQDETTSGWVSHAETIDQQLLEQAPPQVSRHWLRVTVDFHTNQLATTPVLTDWQQTYDCVDRD